MARDGIEPPTQGFSVPLAIEEISYFSGSYEKNLSVCVRECILFYNLCYLLSEAFVAFGHSQLIIVFIFVIGYF